MCPFFLREGRVIDYLESLPEGQEAGPILGDFVDVSQVISSLPKSVRVSLSKPVIAMVVNLNEQEIVKPMLELGLMNRTSKSGLFVLDLRKRTPEHVWRNGFNKHDRQAIKYYERHARFEFTDDVREYLALGRPDWRSFKGRLFNPDYISRIVTTLGDLTKVALVRDSDGQALAGTLMLLDHPRSHDPCVHLRAVRYSVMKNIHSTVTFMDWKALEWANRRGYRFIDFGSYSVSKSSNPGHVFYKLRQRFELDLLQGFQFTLPTSSLSYSIARRVSRILREIK